MCESCIIDHISTFLQGIKQQVLKPCQTSVVVAKMERLVPCSLMYAIDHKSTAVSKIMRFPGNSSRHDRSFVVILRICDIILSNLQAGKIVTTRDIYYQDVVLFRSQDVVLRAIEQVSRGFMIPRYALNIRPSPNGLVAGDIRIAMENGGLLEVKRCNGPSLIPVDNILSASAPRSPPKFILIVEKEAVFSYLQSELPEGIVVTGKGFPDRATRNLLNALSISYPEAPMYGLVDSDPHGILILRSYECGSSRTVDVQLPINIIYMGISLLEYSEGLVPSTLNDIRVAMSTLRKSWINEPIYEKYKTELQRGLFMGMKGEMNLLDKDKSKRLKAYVQGKIREMEQQDLQGKLVQQTRNNNLADKRPRLVCHKEVMIDHQGKKRKFRNRQWRSTIYNRNLVKRANKEENEQLL